MKTMSLFDKQHQMIHLFSTQQLATVENLQNWLLVMSPPGIADSLQTAI